MTCKASIFISGTIENPFIKVIHVYNVLLGINVFGNQCFAIMLENYTIGPCMFYDFVQRHQLVYGLEILFSNWILELI